jgi:hypothetical protein
MADYRLTQSGDEVQRILDNATPQSELAAETQRATEAEQTLQQNINTEAQARGNADTQLQQNIDAEALTRSQADTTLQGNIDAEEVRAKAAEKQNADDIYAIEEKIPTEASSSNQLADKQFVNSSIQTATAEYKGAFNSVSDLHLTTSATRLQIAAALPNVIQSADNNDYCFVQIPVDNATPTVIASVERYKYNGSQWLFEYALNNSGFTQAQWDALNSGITSGLVTKLSALPTNAELATLLAGKQAVIVDLQIIREGAAAGATAVQPAALQQEAETRAAADTALGNRVTTIEGKIPVAASPQNQLADKKYVDDGISTATAEFKGAYNLVTDLHLTITATRSEIATELSTVISGADNNDYAYVQIPVANDAPTTIAKVERYKYNGSAWAFEYELNNSGFTAAQWDAINSGITSGLVSKLSDLPTLAQLTVLLNGKQNTLTFDQAPTEGSSNPVTSDGIFTGITSAIAAALTAYYTKAQTYSQTEVQQLISTTIASYYTKSEVDAAIANFITKSVNDLTNYYLKSETFTKAEVNQLIAAVQQFTYVSVAELPTASAETMNKIYLVPSTNPQQQNVKDEFITVSVTDQGTTTYSWEQIGTTTVDLSGYSTTQQMNAAISSAIATALADYYTKAQTMTSTEINSAITTALLDYTTTSGMTTAINTAINSALADYSTTTQMTSAINAAIALAIADYYTKTEIDALIANFITASVNNLANYYLKSETFTKAEVNALIAGISQFRYQSVQTLPTASADTMGIIYLVPGADPGTQNTKDEYITISSTNEQQVTTYSWEKIGSAEINLDNYYTKSQTDAAITAALASYMTSAQAQTLVVTSIQTALGSYYNKTEIDTLIGAITAKIPTEASSSNQLADKAYVAAQVQEYAGSFRGTFNSVADLEATTGNHHNDYAWVQVTDSDGDNDYDRYKYNGTAWVFEYRLNNTHFTSAQLAAISSGITSEKVASYDSHLANTTVHITSAERQTWNDKQNAITDGAQIGLGYGVCSTDATTVAKTATIDNFLLLKNMPVSIRFTKSINVDGATLNISSTGAKPLFIDGAALQGGLVKAGCTITVIFDGTNWNIICIEGLERPSSQSDLFVDMGLPSGLLWAIANIDMTTQSGFAEVDGKPSPFKYEGTFFSWGNTEGHNPISDSAFSYDWGTGNDGPYAQTPGAALTANAGLSYDAARAILGAPWRDPSTEDFAELFANIDYVQADGETVIDASQANKLVTVNSITGIYLKSKINGKLLFFPCSGYGYGQSWDNRGSGGGCWSRSLYSQTNGRGLSFSSGGVTPQNYNSRFIGFARRAVQ